MNCDILILDFSDFGTLFIYLIETESCESHDDDYNTV